MKEKKRHPHGCKIFMWLPRNWTYSLNDLRLTDRQTLCSITPHTRLGAQHGAAVATRHWSVMDLLIFWSILGIWTYWISKTCILSKHPWSGRPVLLMRTSMAFRVALMFLCCVYSPFPKRWDEKWSSTQIEILNDYHRTLFKRLIWKHELRPFKIPFWIPIKFRVSSLWKRAVITATLLTLPKYYKQPQQVGGNELDWSPWCDGTLAQRHFRNGHWKPNILLNHNEC